MFDKGLTFQENNAEDIKINIEIFLSTDVFRINKENQTTYPMCKGDIAEFVMAALHLQPAANKEVIFKDKETFHTWLAQLKLISEHTEILAEKELPEYSSYAAYVITGITKDSLKKMKSMVFNKMSENYEREYGKLMGFPDTAIEAYLGEREKVSATEGSFEEGFGHFAYSKEFEDIERKYFNDRNKKLEEYAPSLFSK